MSRSVGNCCFSQPEICSGDHCSASFCATRHRNSPWSATKLRAQRPLPGAPLGPVCTVSLRTAVASNLAAYRRWRSFETSCDPTDRPAGRNLTGNLFALLKLQRRHSPATRRRSDPSIESHDPLDPGLVPPFQRPGDGQHTLSVLPALPKFVLLLRREQYP